MSHKYHVLQKLSEGKMLFVVVMFCAISFSTQAQDIYGDYKMDFYDPIGYDNCCSEHATLHLGKDNTFQIKRKYDQGDYVRYDFSSGHFRYKKDKLFFISEIPDSLHLVVDLGNDDRLLANQLMLTFITEGPNNWELFSLEFYEITDTSEKKRKKVIRTYPALEELADTTGGQFIPKDKPFNKVSVLIEKPTTGIVLISHKSGYGLTLQKEQLTSNNLAINYVNSVGAHDYIDFTAREFKIGRNKLTALFFGTKSNGKKYRIVFRK